MDNSTDELGNIPYASSSPDFVEFAPRDTATKEDETDVPALIQIDRLLAARDSVYASNDHFTLGELTLENQLIIARQHRLLIQEVRQIINATITKVKELQDEHRFDA